MTTKEDTEFLIGWDAICEFLCCTRPTAIKYAKYYGMPVGILGSRVVAFKDELEEWLRHYTQPYGSKERGPRRAPVPPGRPWHKEKNRKKTERKKGVRRK
ncbi:MAG TPA: hypothetical protein ENG51_07540 [Deltaproteobacteria bacterium]|nr:hypothetical protein [Deltaproteobacteria bacterium]